MVDSRTKFLSYLNKEPLSYLIWMNNACFDPSFFQGVFQLDLQASLADNLGCRLAYA